MATVAQVLAEHEMGVSEARVAAELRALLGAPADRPALSLTADEDAFLAEHGGVPAASSEQLAALEARSAARVVREVAESLSRSEVADLIGVDESRISHRVRAGTLYSYLGASGRRRYPDWQFRERKPLPRLGVVLEHLPAGAHPVTVRTFMTTPDGALVLNGEPVTPVDWLAAGGAPELVAELAETLGEQV